MGRTRDTGGPDVCPICIAGIRPIHRKTLRCSGAHTFHMKCIWKWIRKSPTCPICREQVIRHPEPGCPFNEYQHYISSFRVEPKKS